MPWKNGRGTTTEIAREPAEGEFDWRISTAMVSANGPFSSFPGYDRVILTLEGAGMRLTHPELEKSVILGPLEPYSFSGDWATDCVLRRGPIRDFNVIARRGSVAPKIRVVSLEERLAVDLSAGTMLLYCVRGSVTVDEPTTAIRKDEALLLETGDTVPSLSLRPGEADTALIVVALSRSADHPAATALLGSQR